MWYACGTGEMHTEFLVGIPDGRRTLGRHRRRWEDNIKMDLRKAGGRGDWNGLLWLGIGARDGQF